MGRFWELMTDGAERSMVLTYMVKLHGQAEFSDIVELVQEAVLDAARYLDQAVHSGKKPEVRVKDDQTLVMNLDVESQRRILARLGSRCPIVAEEDPSSHSLISSANHYFLVDPLDGTTSCKRFLGLTGGQVGYGPLVGYVHDHQLSVCAFYSVPHRTLFTAARGQGSFATTLDGDWRGTPRRLSPPACSSLNAAGMLFFISAYGEARLVEHLRVSNAVENIYRFGGFANDCARLAQGFEQVQLQYNAKPWDFSAVLLAAEAGYEVICDPLDRRIPLASWRIENNNPIVALHSSVRDEFFALVDTMKRDS
jgi:fructose-1,6-bisphosphatase/inositol monophosphatase family enzyme